MSDKKTKDSYETQIYDSLLKTKLIADGVIANDAGYTALTKNQKIIAAQIYQQNEKEQLTEFIKKLEKS